MRGNGAWHHLSMGKCRQGNSIPRNACVKINFYLLFWETKSRKNLVIDFSVPRRGGVPLQEQSKYVFLTPWVPYASAIPIKDCRSELLQWYLKCQDCIYSPWEGG
ncbi:uncharacterized protein TM35_000074280 [Trypanosoma theileri]|uniref:Uncharacterized protein n=1 Tax=Trypanosoma theileri TaxID=67003 RepID=A0A1X0P228_9TRYP|nr:uncharacterized protein TM35_000074280 [Trypanosoma theileri]ORC91004.1 hypothetical protein TM35_000074280 [Trypanosoma theileri]